MPHINYYNQEVVFKIVYYGPGLSGKTTNLLHIHSAMDSQRKGDMVILDTDEERTLFFDFFPLDVGRVGEYNVRLNMYTVPGQIYYEASRRLILEGADGVVFVADSEPARLADNVESFSMLRENLRTFGIESDSFPLVLQYNKRDLPDPILVGTLEEILKLNGIPIVEAVATAGHGVMETIRIASRMVIERFDF
jgi:hypothetical protein